VVAAIPAVSPQEQEGEVAVVQWVALVKE
jgi:hypothetical protein